MTINYKKAVQKVRLQYVQVDFGDLPSGTFVGLIELPPGAIPVDGAAYVLTASDAATSETFTVGTASAPSSYGTVANSKIAGLTALTMPAAPTTGRTVVGITRTEVGAQTVGTYSFYIEYAIVGGSDATQG